MHFAYYVLYAAIAVFILAIFSYCSIVRRRRFRGQVIQSAPVVVTTTSTHVPFTPGQQMQHGIIQTNQVPYPVGQQVHGYGMPMPVSNQSYAMPQAGYPPYPAAGAPYPPAGPHESMNPPSYDQVVGSGPTVPTTTHTNENFAKQSPYNPNYHG